MKTLLELSREKLHAYRDEARLTDIPDKDMSDHLRDERTDKEKMKRRKGINNASDALQRIHKAEAKKAKEERKNKPPKPKKPDSRITLRKAAKLGSLWSEEKKMLSFKEFISEEHIDEVSLEYLSRYLKKARIDADKKLDDYEDNNNTVAGREGVKRTLGIGKAKLKMYDKLGIK